MLTKFPQCNFSLELLDILKSKFYMLSLSEFVWEFQNNALWDTHEHALLKDNCSE